MVGKGDKQDVVRFSDRSMKALKNYLAARAFLDGASGKPLTSFPSLPDTILALDEKLSW
jgi:integrase/recombinase XerC